MAGSAAARLLLGLVTVAAAATVGDAARAAPPEPASARIVAVRDSVAAVVLKSPPSGQGLPVVVPVSMVTPGSRTELEGRVVWLCGSLPRLGRRWTQASNPLVVRTLSDGEDPRALLAEGRADRVATVEGPLLMVDLPPAEGETTLAIGEFTVAIDWLEAAPPPVVDPERGAAWSDATPDPESPFDWFRWLLWAERRGEAAPAPPGDAGSQLMARHVASLWRAGLDRVARRSRGVADALARWLTATCREGRDESAREIAAWIADPADLSSLLAILIDAARDDEVVMQAALAWMDARTPLIVWIESDGGGAVVLRVANPLDEEAVLQGQWLGETEPPVAALIPPRTIGRVRVERPHRSTVRATVAGEDPQPVVLAVFCKRFAKRIALAPGAVPARPPGLNFGSFVPALSLSEAQTGRMPSTPSEWITNATLRRRVGGWEVFLECFVPPGGSHEDDAVRIRVRGREAVIRRDGAVDAGPELIDARVRAYADRWRARFVLPEEWIPPVGETMVLRIGMRREAGPLRATAVVPVPAIDPTLPEVDVDLALWLDITPPLGDEMP